MMLKLMKIGKKDIFSPQICLSSFKARTLTNVPYFSYSSINQNTSSSKKMYRLNAVRYCHFYFDQNVQGFEEISKAAS
jgi:hypothetical protein